MQLSTKSIAVTLLTVCGVLASAAGFAEDGKRYPGAGCQPLYDSDSQFLNNLYGKKNNTSSTRGVYVVCPVIKDNYHNGDGTKSARVQGYMYNQATNSSNDFRCWLYSKFISNGGGWTSYASSQNRGFAYMDLDVNSSADPGYYFIQCRIPPSAILSDYSVVEH